MYSSLMQASPGHMLFIACLFTAIISCEPVGQGRATAAPKEPWCRNTLPHGMLGPSFSPSQCQHKDPVPAPELCTLPFPADGSTWCQKSRAHCKSQLGPCVSDSYLYTTDYIGLRLLPQNQVWGKRTQELFICKSAGITTCYKRTLKCK